MLHPGRCTLHRFRSSPPSGLFYCIPIPCTAHPCRLGHPTPTDAAAKANESVLCRSHGRSRCPLAGPPAVLLALLIAPFLTFYLSSTPGALLDPPSFPSWVTLTAAPTSTTASPPLEAVPLPIPQPSLASVRRINKPEQRCSRQLSKLCGNVNPVGIPNHSRCDGLS